MRGTSASPLLFLRRFSWLDGRHAEVVNYFGLPLYSAVVFEEGDMLPQKDDDDA